MKKLPHYLAECPDYEWNPRTQMYDAKIYTVDPDGVKIYTEGYSIPESTFLLCIRAMQEAVRKKQFPPAATVLPLKRKAKKSET